MACLLALTGCLWSRSGDLSIDGARALEHATRIVSWGPHPPGSPAQKRAGVYLIQQLEAVGLEVETQAFTAPTPLGPIEMVNILGRLEPTGSAAAPALILASHYDSKLFRDRRFVGANDGAASSAVVLELARVLSSLEEREVPFWFLFFDGEEALVDWTERDSLYGSRHFVSALGSQGRLGEVGALILLDLIGGRPLRINQEANSTRWLTEIIWDKAGELDLQSVFLPGRSAIEDDHVPFLDAGIPAVDLIDLSYPYWHTDADTVDKLSIESMETVGRVVLAALPEIVSEVRVRR